MPQHLDHAVHEFGDVHRLGSEILPTGEGEHAFGERRPPLRALNGAVDQAYHLRLIREVFFRQFQVAEHRHQQVVEIMRDATCQLAEAFELLHLMNLRERILALSGALFDPLLELGVGPGELGRPFDDPTLELRVEPLELPCLTIELGEYFDLGPQQLRYDRYRNIVHRSKLIATQQVDIGHLNSRNENDRGFLKARVLADHRRQLKAVEIGHADIDQNDRHIAFQQQLQRLRRRAGLDQVLPDLVQDCFIAQQLGRLIVDQENVDFFLVRHEVSPLRSHASRRNRARRAPGKGKGADLRKREGDGPLAYGFYRWSHIRKADSSCSVSTGLAR